jgi:hypothetical protein
MAEKYWSHRKRSDEAAANVGATCREDGRPCCEAVRFPTRQESAGHLRGQMCSNCKTKNVSALTGTTGKSRANNFGQIITDVQKLDFSCNSPMDGGSAAAQHVTHIKFAEQRAMGRKVSDKFTVPICRRSRRVTLSAGLISSASHLVGRRSSINSTCGLSCVSTARRNFGDDQPSSDPLDDVSESAYLIPFHSATPIRRADPTSRSS